METTKLQNPLHQQSASEVTPKKKKPRHRWSKKRIPPVLENDIPVVKPVTSHSLNTANQSTNSVSPNLVENLVKPKKPRKRRRYFKNPSAEPTKIENNLLPLSEHSALKEVVAHTSLESSGSNNISRSPMEKMKREDDTKTKEHVLAERDARRLAKQKVQDKSRNLENSLPKKAMQKPNDTTEKKVKPPVTVPVKSDKISANVETKSDKSREDILAERELKKQAKLAIKSKTKEIVTPSSGATATLPQITKKIENVTISDKPVLSKAERREKQEAQRAAKAKLLAEKTPAASVQPSEKEKTTGKVENVAEKHPSTKKVIVPKHRVKLFNHLYVSKGPDNVLNSNLIHPAIVKLGAQYANGNIVGSNARCIAFMERIKKVIEDYETPSQKEFGRGLEAILQPSVHYLNQCRPLSVSITNALKFIKWQISQLPANQSDADLKEHLLESVDTYVRDQIEKAAQAISITVQEKISNGDVILTFGCSSLISHIIEEAQKRKVDFSVIVVDSRPHHEGQEMLRRLVTQKIRCTCVLINAIGFVMPDVTKVLLGANALMANGYVMSRAGTAQIALMAKSYNVPVLVCCETHKFSERVQTDAFVLNEIGDPQDLVLKTAKHTPNEMQNWKTIPQLTPLNLRYDITPPELVTAVVTELAILPCTSVPVILRIKPSEIGY